MMPATEEKPMPVFWINEIQCIARENDDSTETKEPTGKRHKDNGDDYECYEFATSALASDETRLSIRYILLNSSLTNQ